MMNFAEMKNDTARKNAARIALMDSVYPALVATWGEENVVRIDFPITVMDSENHECGDISGNSIAVCVGQTVDKTGATVDMVSIIECTIKAFNTVTNKSNRTTYAMNFDDVLRAIETGRTERAEKAAEKAREKAERDVKKAKK